jgi:hypothetical protein
MSAEIEASGWGTCSIVVQLDPEFGLDSVNYSGAPVRVYLLKVTVAPGSASPTVSNADGFRFKQDGSVGRASTPIGYRCLTWEALPNRVKVEVREAYHAWVASLPQALL